MTKTIERPNPGASPSVAGRGTNRLVLASASPARRMLLERAGVTFEIMVADVDEGAIRDHLLSQNISAGKIASALARAKAEHVSVGLDQKTTVIGADQILLFEGDIFEKPENIDSARDTLKRLSGKTHKLISAVTAYRAGEEIWSCFETARLTMRDFSDDFLEKYLQEDEGQLASVGAYRLEGAGAQLFSCIEGDFFTILGLPLLPLLEFLRAERLMPS